MEHSAVHKLNPDVVSALARCFLAGEQSAAEVAERGSRTLGRSWQWLGPLAKRYVVAFGGKTRPRHDEVVQFLNNDDGFQRAWARSWKKLRVIDQFVGSMEMQPVSPLVGLDIPAINTVRELANWLAISASELEWFTDLKGLGRYARCGPRLRHYHYRVFTKRSGSVRVIEAPKQFLKKLQRKILTEILDEVPAHQAAHGFVGGRSIKSFAAPHVERGLVLRMDLRNFFPSIPGVRVQTMFRTLGYPESVADLLGGLCTNVVPRDVWRSAGQLSAEVSRDLREIYDRRHLPQGAPTSPSVANICAFRVDCRLTGLAESMGAVYTRYADDLAFSGGVEFERGAERFATQVGAILLEEGFAANHCKTRILRRGVRQQLAGLVVNEHLNVRRSDFDELKAILTNCVRKGAASQNRDGRPFFRTYLEGRVAFVESVRPEKGRRLRRLLEQIDWAGF